MCSCAGSKALEDQAGWTAGLGIALWIGAIALAGVLIGMTWADYPWPVFLVLQLLVLPCAAVPPFLFTLGYIGSHDQARALQETALQVRFSARAACQTWQGDKLPPPLFGTVQ